MPSRSRRNNLRRWRSAIAAALLGAVLAGGVRASATSRQERGPTPLSAEDLSTAIGRLGDLDYPTRMKAARAVRRAPGATAAPALLQAFREHADGYVRFRALVLLTGFADPRTADAMQEALTSPNDRLREVAYGYFEHAPNPTLAPKFLASLDSETGEFVRPSLVRALAALAAQGNAPARDVLIRDAARGVDYFRSTVIEALGDFKITAAVPRLIEVARLEGPLQDDAVLALGRIGDKTAMGALAELQRTGAEVLQPAIATGFCLMGQNCTSHIGFLQKTLGFAEDVPGYQDLLRGAASGLGALGAAGQTEATGILLDVGVPSEDPVRAPVALAVGMIALRNLPAFLDAVETRKDRDAVISLLAEGFDMLEEDLEEERFFAAVRRTYWAAADGSPRRALCEQLITRLDF
ncbi:MAG: HEAT repeat domain-containing protein [Acidobacteria bacterium]|nr:HEAT repeat domain-containing protein [Acidobacteriota bacterium]